MSRLKISYCYYSSLPTLEKKRYEKKIAVIGFDPYDIKFVSLQKNIDDDGPGLPLVTYPDIVNYLVLKTSWVTMDAVKSYKSLDSYNYFVSGFVNIVKLIKCNEEEMLVCTLVS